MLLEATKSGLERNSKAQAAAKRGGHVRVEHATTPPILEPLRANPASGSHREKSAPPRNEPHHEFDLLHMDEFSVERSGAIIEAAARGQILDGHEQTGEVLTGLHAPAQATGVAPLLPAANPGLAGRIARRSGVAASAAVLGLASVAAAATGPLGLLGHEGPPAAEGEEAEDTVFNFGYDEELHLLVTGTSSTEGDYDCSLEQEDDNPSYLTRYAVGEDEIAVDELSLDGEAVEFPARDGESDPVVYGDAEECALGAAEVAGPNGQVNHGQFMKTFNELYEGTGRGCINRHLAQSDLGKGDQQIKVSDVDPDFESVADGDQGEVTFSTILADCERGNGNGNGNGNGRGNGHRTDIDEDSAADDDDEDDEESEGRGNGNGNGRGNGNGNGRGNGNGNGNG